MDGYASEIETQMIRFFDSLCERDRRRYAAVEALKLGHGGIAYISQLLGCDAQTIKHGMTEVCSDQVLDLKRQRKKTAAARRRKLHRHKLSKTSGKSSKTTPQEIRCEPTSNGQISRGGRSPNESPNWELR